MASSRITLRALPRPTKAQQMTDSSSDDFRFEMNTLRWIDADVTSQLSRRGWAVNDLSVGATEPLEWFWPPTAPVGYGGLPDWSDEPMQRRPQLFGPRLTPWIRPTRISGTTTGTWIVEYGEAAALQPAALQKYEQDAELVAELERIECWPMTVEETQQLRVARVFEVTTAMAHNAHYLGVLLTEPYASRQNLIRVNQRYEHSQYRGTPGNELRPVARLSGDLASQSLLNDAEAWASAVRTARAGGDGWGVNGPVATRT